MKFTKCFLIVTLFLMPLFSAFAEADWDDYQKSGHTNIKWDDFVRAGFSAFDSGNLGSSEMFLQRAIARGCNDGLVFMKIGLYYESQANYQKALDYFQKANKKLPTQYPKNKNTEEVGEAVGRSLYLMGKTEESIPYLKQTLEKGENFMALYFLGQISRTKGDYPTAINYFERSLKADHPRNFASVDLLIMIELGKGYYELKDVDTSLTWWNRILEVQPNNQTALSYKNKIEHDKYKEKERKALEQIVQ